MHSIPQMSPGGDLNTYKFRANAESFLSHEEEIECFNNILHRGCSESRARIINAHLRHVIQIYSKFYSGYGLCEEDLIQEGNIGLLKSIDRFEPDRGFRLISFAAHWIRNEMSEYVIKNYRIVKFITTASHKKAFFNLRRMRKSNVEITVNEAHEIADKLKIDVRDVYHVYNQFKHVDDSFYQYDDALSDTYTKKNAESFIGDTSTAPLIVNELENNNTIFTSIIDESLRGFDCRTRKIIEHRWLSEKKRTLAELSGDYGLSPEGVRKIEKKAFKDLKIILSKHLTPDDLNNQSIESKHVLAVH